MVITFNCKNMMNLSRIMITKCVEILFRSYSLQFEPYLWWNICAYAFKNLQCAENPKATFPLIVTSTYLKRQHIERYDGKYGMMNHLYYVRIYYIHHHYVSCGILQEIILALTMYYIVFYPGTYNETLGEYTFLTCCFIASNAKYYPKTNELYLSKVYLVIFSYIIIQFQQQYYCIHVPKLLIFNILNGIYSCSKYYKYTKYTLINDITEENWNKMTKKAVNLSELKITKILHFING
eukprot:464587_1